MKRCMFQNWYLLHHSCSPMRYTNRPDQSFEYNYCMAGVWLTTNQHYTSRLHLKDKWMDTKQMRHCSSYKMNHEMQHYNHLRQDSQEYMMSMSMEWLTMSRRYM
jgi:hypothetical protein